MFNIAFTGPSGSGKTTLANYLAEILGVDMISNSANDILSPTVKAYWHETYGYESKGHKNVISLGHQYPKFGFEFQRALLAARISLVESRSKIDSGIGVYDRCFIDNIAYMLLQAGPYLTDQQVRDFVYDAANKLTLYDLIIFVPTQNPTDIEDNQSRISNIYYQKAVTKVFELAIDMVKDLDILRAMTEIITVPSWNLGERKDFIDQALAGLTNRRRY
jgi:predicted ATPase